MPWDADRYLKFEAERFAPFQDCLALLRRRPGLRVVDLGCGTGELTRRLKEALPGSEVLGVDSSVEMLAKARPEPGLSFEHKRIEEVSGQWDLVFSHAAIHWVDDHRALVPRLFGLVAPGGQLLVQLPSNHDHPANRAVRELAAEFTDYTRAVPVLSIAEYAELLYAAGGRELVVFEKVYPHVLPSADAVAEWTRGTTMVPYLEHIAPERHAAYLERYRAHLRALWPSGPVFYGFRRILFSVIKG